MMSAGIHKSKLFYLYTILLLIVGAAWLVWSYTAEAGQSICLFRHITGWPCPSCGSTRSILFLLDGQYRAALYANPLGYVSAVGMLVGAGWAAFDTIAGRQSMYRAYYHLEGRLRSNPVLLIFILLPVIILWIWKLMHT